MEFRLIYDGPLHASNQKGNRPKEKHSIRKVFHSQLRELWNQHPLLRQQLTRPVLCRRGSDDDEYYPGGMHFIDISRMAIRPGGNKLRPVHIIGSPPDEEKPIFQHIADNYNSFGYRFLPLVSKENGVICAVEILFLRRDNPGGLIVNAGDIDNRMKTLFDAFRMPQTKAELGGHEPEEHENPFFCLVQDDSLITSGSVTTDRLLQPSLTNHKRGDVHLIISVKTRIINPNVGYNHPHSF
jgi:hypothetical protein